jgi:hypothetical protein
VERRAGAWRAGRARGESGIGGRAAAKCLPNIRVGLEGVSQDLGFRGFVGCFTARFGVEPKFTRFLAEVLFSPPAETTEISEFPFRNC